MVTTSPALRLRRDEKVECCSLLKAKKGVYASRATALFTKICGFPTGTPKIGEVEKLKESKSIWTVAT